MALGITNFASSLSMFAAMNTTPTNQSAPAPGHRVLTSQRRLTLRFSWIHLVQAWRHSGIPGIMVKISPTPVFCLTAMVILISGCGEDRMVRFATVGEQSMVLVKA